MGFFQSLTTGIEKIISNALFFLYSYKLEASILVLLTMLNTGSTLLLRYSRGILKEQYSAAVGVLGVEILKFVVSAIMVARQKSPEKSLMQAYIDTMKTSLPSAVPAVLYSVQNGLAYIALQYLEAGVFAVVQQSRLLTTGLFSVLFLKRKLTGQHWRALIVLIISVILVENECTCPTVSTELANAKTENAGTTEYGQQTGVIIVLIMACLSSFTGVYWEKVLKGGKANPWERNFQLALYSIIVSCITIFYKKPSDLLPSNLISGVSIVSIILFTTQASQGIVTAFVTKYTSTIIRNYSSTASLCITAILSVYLFDAKLSLFFWLGLSLVLISMNLYGEASSIQTERQQQLQQKQELEKLRSLHQQQKAEPVESELTAGTDTVVEVTESTPK